MRNFNNPSQDLHASQRHKTADPIERIYILDFY